MKAEREDVNKPRIVIQLVPTEQSFQKLLGDLLAFHTLAYSEVMIFKCIFPRLLALHYLYKLKLVQ